MLQTEGQGYGGRPTVVHGTRLEHAETMLYALWVVAGISLLVWMLGVGGAITVGNGIHFLLLVAILAVMSSLFTRPRTI
jgi:hypothetical protein